MRPAAKDPQSTPARDRAPLRLGISACLLGEPVRFDGGHKRDAFLTDVLGPQIEWVAVCPEVEIGMGTPRETLRLVRRDDTIALWAERSGTDWTQRMRRFAAQRVRGLAALDLCGYVLKKDSPSCGMERVRVYGPAGMPERKGRGLFAAALTEALPLLPIEEEGRLCDPVLRENFIERIFAYRRLRDFFAARWTQGGLVAFHAAHKYQLLSHSETGYRALGRLVAEGRRLPRGELRRRYEEGFMQALSMRATVRRHVNVLQHMLGFFKQRLDAADKQEALSVIDDYRRGLVPLVVPLTLLRHFVRRFDVAYLQGQHYLEPHPRELMLRNHV